MIAGALATAGRRLWIAKLPATALGLLIAAVLLGGAGQATAAGCPNEAVRQQQGSSYLADCRGYELASPADTNGNPVYGTIPSPGGERVAIAYQGGVPGSTSGGFSLFLSQRDASGWQPQSLLPAGAELADVNYAIPLASTDLGRFLAIADHGYPFPKSPLELLRLDVGSSQSLLYGFDPVVDVIPQVAASADMTHVLANVAEQIDPEQEPGTRNVYDFGASPPVLVSRMPDGSVPACGVPPTGVQSFGMGASIGTPQRHIVSLDGRRAFFNSRGASCGGPADLYLRDLQAATTTLISGPPLAGSDGGAVLVRASADGSQVTYVTSTQLDPADLNTTRDLYRYTVGVGNECLTCVVEGAAVTNPNASDFPLASEDGSRIYFTTTNALTGEDTDGTKSAYLWSGGTISYVAPSDGIGATARTGAQASPDGRILVFRSRQPQLDALSGRGNGGFFQYYRYDDASGETACISCPEGAPAGHDVPIAMSAAAFTTSQDAPIMSADGDLIVFTSSDPLVPEDSNEDQDLYEWRNGAVSLITDGRTPYTQFFGNPATGSQLIGVSADGEDILFASFSSLTPDVLDTGQPTSQVYDARVGGGFPQPSPPAPCAEEGCRSGASVPPPSIPAATDTFAGAGNARQARRHHRRRHRHHHRRHRQTAAAKTGTSGTRTTPATERGVKR